MEQPKLEKIWKKQRPMCSSQVSRDLQLKSEKPPDLVASLAVLVQAER